MHTRVVRDAFSWANQLFRKLNKGKGCELVDVSISDGVLWIFVKETVIVRKWGIPFPSKRKVFWRVTQDGDLFKCRVCDQSGTYEERPTTGTFPGTFLLGLELMLSLERLKQL